MNTLFPIFIKQESMKVLLVGAGNVGLEKLTALVSNSPLAEITVVSGLVKTEIFELARIHTNIIIYDRDFVLSDLDNKNLIILATDNPTLHVETYKVAKEKNILCNVADVPHLCDFYLGSIVQKGDLKIAISTNGKSPTMAKRLKAYFEKYIPNEFQSVLENLYALRKKLKGDFQEKIKVLNEITAGLSKFDEDK